MKRALAKFALVLFLSTVLSPCGLVPFHEEHGLGHSHQPGGDHAATKASVRICGTDIAAPSGKSGAAVLCPSRPAPDFDSVAAWRDPVATPAIRLVHSRAGPPPRQTFIQTQRLLL